MKLTTFLALPYLPLALLTGAGATAGAGAESAHPHITAGPRGPGVSLTAPGGAGHSPGPLLADTRRRADGPTLKEIRDRTDTWLVKRIESPRWRLVMGDRVNVRSDAPIDAVRYLGVHAELAIDLLGRALGGDVADIRFSVRVFDDPHDFDVFASICGAKGAASFYDVRNTEAVVLWDAQAGRASVARLLRHEVAHLYMDRVFDRTGPIWLCEGTAEWVEHSTWSEGRYVPGADAPHHLETLSKAIRAGTLLPLRKMLAATRDEFYDESRWRLYYAQAWALVRVLAKDPAALPKLAAGVPLAELRDLSALEEEWKEWMRARE